MSPYDMMEKLIDKYNVENVLLMISDICNEKAEHIDTSYGGVGLVGKWNKAGQVVRRAMRALPKVPGIK